MLAAVSPRGPASVQLESNRSRDVVPAASGRWKERVGGYATVAASLFCRGRSVCTSPCSGSESGGFRGDGRLHRVADDEYDLQQQLPHNETVDQLHGEIQGHPRGGNVLLQLELRHVWCCLRASYNSLWLHVVDGLLLGQGTQWQLRR